LGERAAFSAETPPRIDSVGLELPSRFNFYGVCISLDLEYSLRNPS
jgi:hypothetical protein